MQGLPVAAPPEVSGQGFRPGGPRTSGRESKADAMALAAVQERAMRPIRRTATGADPGAIDGVPARLQRGDQDELQEAARQDSFGERRGGDARAEGRQAERPLGDHGAAVGQRHRDGYATDGRALREDARGGCHTPWPRSPSRRRAGRLLPA